jgi:hypothetical protein
MSGIGATRTFRNVRELTETLGGIKEPRRWQAATRLADGERGDERAIRRRVLLHQALQGFRHPMDGMGWQYPKSVRQLLICNEHSALRDAFEKCTRPCMRRHPIVLSKNSALSAATVTRLASCLLHLSIIVNRLPNEQFSFYVVQDAQPIRFLWHLKRIEERLRFHRCSVEIVSDYRNPIQSRVRLVNRPGAKKLDGEIHHETAHFFIPSVPRQREG